MSLSMPQFQSNGLIKYYIRLEKYLFKFEFQRKKREKGNGTWNTAKCGC